MMRRVVFCVAGFSVVFAAAIGGSAGIAQAAPAPPPSGSITCGFASAATVSPGLLGTAYLPTKNGVPQNKAAKISTLGTASACNTAGVTGGKAQITGGSFKGSGKGTGRTCDAAANGGGSTVLKTSIKWTGAGAVNVASTKANLTIGALTFEDGAAIALPTSPADQIAYVTANAGRFLKFTLTGTSTGKAFLNRNIAVTGVTDQTFLTFVTGCTATPIGLTGFSFSPAKSSVTVS